MHKYIIILFSVFITVPSIIAQTEKPGIWQNEEIGYHHMLKTSFFGLIDLSSHCIEIGYETRIADNKYLDFSMGYSPNFQRNSNFESDFYGIRSQVMYKKYFIPAILSKRSGSYYGFAFRNTFLWDQRDSFFSRYQGLYIQEYNYTHQKIKSALYLSLGNVSRFRNVTIEFGLMAGATHFFTNYKGVDEDATLVNSDFFSLTRPKGHSFLPSFKAIFKLGYILD